jgi:hypothetical protein
MVRVMDDRLEQRRFKRMKALENARKGRLDKFVSEVMKLPEGREFMYWLLELAKVGRNPFTANALTTSFNCGELNVGQQIQSHIMDVAPDGYLQMLKERQEEEYHARTTLERDLNDSSDTTDGDSGRRNAADAAD